MRCRYRSRSRVVGQRQTKPGDGAEDQWVVRVQQQPRVVPLALVGGVVTIHRARAVLHRGRRRVVGRPSMTRAPPALRRRSLVRDARLSSAVDVAIRRCLALPAPVPLTSRDDPRPERLHAPPRPLGVQPARRPRADHGARRRGGPAGDGFARDHRPRRALRRGRLLPGGEEQGHQADHRDRDLRRPPVDDRQGGQGRQPALPPDPARPGLAGLPEPLPARDRRPPRRLLLQAAHRPRAPRQAQRRADRAVGLPRAARSPRRSRSTTGSSPARSPASTATSSARTASSSSSRTTACPSSGGSTSSCSGSRPRPGSRSSSPTTSTTSARTRPRRTTSCSASARATTSTRRTA